MNLRERILVNISDRFLPFEERNHKTSAIIYMLMSSFSFSVMNIFVKFSKNIPPYQVIHFRSFSNILICILLLRNKDQIIDSNKTTYRLLLTRGVIGAIGLSLYYHSLYFLPLSVAVVLMMMSPLWVGLIGQIMMGEKFKFYQLVLNFVSLVGVIFILKPSIFFENPDLEIDINQTSSNFYYALGVLLALSTSIISACVFVTIRQLKNRTNPIVIVFYFNFFNAIYSGVGLFYEKSINLNATELFYLIIIGISGLTSQISRSRALFLEKAFILSVVDYSQIIFGYLSDIFIFKNDLDFFCTVGCALIVCSTIVLIYLDKKKD